MKKYMALLLALALVWSLAACGGLSATADYTVRVVNAKGQPYSAGVIVRFHQNGTQVAMQVVDENGTVTKNLDKGSYTVDLMFTDSEAGYVYDQTDLTLSADKKELEISLAYELGEEETQLYIQDASHGAKYVGVGCTQVPLTPGGRTYYLFAPKEPGTYEIGVFGQVSGFGCYGTPFYIQEFPIFEVKDNSFTTSITADMIGSGEGGSNVYVLGIDSESAESCVLSVDRTGDPAWTPEQEPYQIYQTTATLGNYSLPKGAKVLTFDLTAATDAYKLVFNESDGSYHLNTADGPQVLVYLGKDNQYTSCFQEMLTKTGVRKYFYDENGNFLRRESYDECLREYFEYMDEKEGVYPLTEDLKYIIQQRGDHGNWFKLDSEESIFQDSNGDPIPGINAEIAWLFMCGYIAS